VYGLEAGRSLVTHPAIAAVGFTGSVRAAARCSTWRSPARPDPVLRRAGLAQPDRGHPGRGGRPRGGGSGRVRRLVHAGTGQFCTKPGLLFLPAGHGLADALAGRSARPRSGRCSTRASATASPRGGRAGGDPGVRRWCLAPQWSHPDTPRRRSCSRSARPTWPSGRGAARGVLRPGRAGGGVRLGRGAHGRPGRGAGSLTADAARRPEAEADLVRSLLAQVSAKAGRVIWDGWPTGVARDGRQHHGGPWPATTSVLHTSVGTAAVAPVPAPGGVPEPAGRAAAAAAAGRQPARPAAPGQRRDPSGPQARHEPPRDETQLRHAQSGPSDGAKLQLC
jgi:NADP-dependent aldehyde dehydrogenase